MFHPDGSSSGAESASVRVSPQVVCVRDADEICMSGGCHAQSFFEKRDGVVLRRGLRVADGRGREPRLRQRR